MAWIKGIVMAGIITVLACAGIFELLERRKRAAFKKQVHDLAQKYIDKMKQEEHIKECASRHGQTYPPTMRLVYLGGGAAARLPQGRGPTCWGQKEYSGAARMGGGYLSDAAFLSGTASAGGGAFHSARCQPRGVPPETEHPPTKERTTI